MSSFGSPRLNARIAGGLYLIIIGAAMYAEAGVRGQLIVAGDAASSARNILTAQQIYRLGGGADLLTLLCDVAVAGLFLGLFRVVDRSLSVMSAFFRLTHAAVFTLAAIAHLAVLAVLTDPGMAAFTPMQLQALATLFFRLHDLTYNVALLFFGVHCILLGLLVARSRFLPVVIGWLLIVAGCGYLVNSATHLVFTGNDFFPWILLPGLVAEASLTLWLLVFGIDPARWHAAAAIMQQRDLEQSARFPFAGPNPN